MSESGGTTGRYIRTRALQHLRTPLYGTSYALSVSVAGTAALGLVYWAVAARNYSADQVGVQSVILSTMLFLAGLSQSLLNSMLIRYLPVARAGASGLVRWSYTVGVVAAVLFATVFVLGTSLWAPNLGFLRTDPLWFVSFVAATAAWCVFTLQDTVLVALRRATWVPLENVGVSVAKVALLVLFASVLAHAGLFASWMFPAAAAVLVVNFLLFRRVLRPLSRTDAGGSPALGTLFRFAGGNYVGVVLSAASSNLLPLVVLNRAGTKPAAYFFLPWTITSALVLVAANSSISLTVESARDISQLQSYCRRTLTHTFAIVAGPVAVFCLGAPLVLSLFGSGYAEHGATTLRLLSLGVLPNAVVLIGLGVLRIHLRLVRIAVLQALAFVLLIGLSFALLPTFGITGVGIAFLVSQTVAATVLLVTDLRPIVRVSGDVRP